jgi:hypothetical protein
VQAGLEVKNLTKVTTEVLKRMKTEKMEAPVDRMEKTVITAAIATAIAAEVLVVKTVMMAEEMTMMMVEDIIRTVTSRRLPVKMRMKKKRRMTTYGQRDRGIGAEDIEIGRDPMVKTLGEIRGAIEVIEVGVMGIVTLGGDGGVILTTL